MFKSSRNFRKLEVSRFAWTVDFSTSINIKSVCSCFTADWMAEFRFRYSSTSALSPEKLKISSFIEYSDESKSSRTFLISASESLGDVVVAENEDCKIFSILVKNFLLKGCGLFEFQSKMISWIKSFTSKTRENREFRSIFMSTLCNSDSKRSALDIAKR